MSETDRDAADAAGLNPESERADGARRTVPRRAMLKTGAAAGAAAAAFLLAPKIGGGGTASADPGHPGNEHGQAGDPPGQSGDASGPPAAAPGQSSSAPPHLAVPLRERTVTVHVLADLINTFVIFGGGDTGPFHVRGDLVENDDGTGAVVGKFQCWGVIHDGGAVVTQEYELDGQGKIVTAGVEDNEPRPITGGTGDFSNVRGEMSTDLTLFPDPNNFFTAIFSLIG